MLLVLYFVSALVLGSFAQQAPTPVPSGGVAVPPAPVAPSEYVQKEGQLITGVVGVNAFGFYVASGNPCDVTAYASIGTWNSDNSVTELKTVPVTIPQSSDEWELVMAPISATGLTPSQTYIIYFSFLPSPTKSYLIAQASSSTQGAVSALEPLVSGIGSNFWGFANTAYMFALVTPTSNSGAGPWLPYDCGGVGCQGTVSFGIYTIFTNTMGSSFELPPYCASTYVANNGPSTTMASSCSSNCVFVQSSVICLAPAMSSGDCSLPYTTATFTWSSATNNMNIVCTQYA